MSRLIVRAHKHPFRSAGAQKVLDKNLFGSNVGNLVFAQAVIRLLSLTDEQLPTSGLIGRSPSEINAEFEHVIIPLANAFRHNYIPSLDGLSDLIENLTIPVTVVGVGAQASLAGRAGHASRLKPAVSRFVKAVLARSPSIGVRGEFTRDFLAELGFGDEHVDVIGCPSMFMYGPDLPATRSVTSVGPDSPVAINISPYVKEMGPASHELAQRYPKLVYIPQDLRSLNLMLWGEYPRTSTRVTEESGVPITLDHPLVAGDRIRFCLDPQTWFAHLAGYDFSFGTRIHGNIAAVLAGTPAVVLAHDSRTLELADYHAIPHRVIKELDRIDPAELFADAEWDTMSARHPELWTRFAAFLDRHGLDHVYAGGHDTTAFDRQLAEVKFPKPVTTLMGEKPARLYAMKREVVRLRAAQRPVISRPGLRRRLRSLVRRG